MSTPDSKKIDFVCFIANWDEALGPTVIDVYPKENKVGDIEGLAIQIFMTFQTVFGNSADVAFKRTNLMLPLNSIERKAKILMETYEDPRVRGGLMPFIAVILLPEAFPDKRIAIFDELFFRIAMEYAKVKGPVFPAFATEIDTLYNAEKGSEEAVIQIDASYSLTLAMNDFKTGLTFFQKKMIDSAYSLIKKAYLKFDLDNQDKLKMETCYILATILLQQGHFTAALKYYQTLESLAKQQSHQKYSESSMFMQCYCAYKSEDYINALNFFDKIKIDQMQSINKLQFFTIKARTLQKLDLIDKAIAEYERALEMGVSGQETDQLKKQRAQILYELGILFYQSAVNLIKTGGFKDATLMQQKLDRAITYFNGTLEIWELLSDFTNLIGGYSLLANIFENRGNYLKAIEHYRKAWEFAKKINDLPRKIRIVQCLVQVQMKVQQYDQSINDIDQIITEVQNIAFVDLYTIAAFHRKLAEIFIILKQIDKALEQYIVALNIYNRVSTPIPEIPEVLEDICQIYQSKNDIGKVSYYKSEKDRVLRKLQERQVPAVKKNRTLGDVKEIWIFTESGILVFSYAPETEVNPELLGGFLAAMQSFSQEISKKNLNAMIIGSDRYAFYREPDWNYYILGRSSNKVPENTVKDILQKIFHRFSTEFATTLKNFNGDVTPIGKFNEILKTMDFK